MKRAASTHSLLTIPFAIPAYWTPDQALAIVKLLDGVRELILAHYGMPAAYYHGSAGSKMSDSPSSNGGDDDEKVPF
jgi:hypothetical protein